MQPCPSCGRGSLLRSNKEALGIRPHSCRLLALSAYTLWGKVLRISYEPESPPLGKNSTIFPMHKIPQGFAAMLWLIQLQLHKSRGRGGFSSAGQAEQGFLPSLHAARLFQAPQLQGGPYIPAVSSLWAQAEARAVACDGRGEQRDPHSHLEWSPRGCVSLWAALRALGHGAG